MATKTIMEKKMPKGKEYQYATKKQLKELQKVQDFNFKNIIKNRSMIDKLGKKIKSKKFRR